MTLITCIDKNGNENNFRYQLDVEEISNGKKWKISVIPVQGKDYTDFFFFSGENIAPDTIKITMMNHHNDSNYVAKGISERLIQELFMISKNHIISSSNNQNSKVLCEEYRTDSATKVWERLRKEGKATYNPEQDIYEYISENNELE